MQQERQGEIEDEVSMEESAGPLLFNKLEVQRQYASQRVAYLKPKLPDIGTNNLRVNDLSLP